MTSSTKSATTVVLGVASAAVLSIVGITFFALAVALPVSLAAVQELGLYASASDWALATQLSSFAPLFVVIAIGFLVASLAVIVKLIQRVSPAPVA